MLLQHPRPLQHASIEAGGESGATAAPHLSSSSATLPGLARVGRRRMSCCIREHVYWYLQERWAPSAVSHRVSTLHPYTARQHNRVTGAPGRVTERDASTQQPASTRGGLNHLQPENDWSTP